jgi:hypothetical protein
LAQQRLRERKKRERLELEWKAESWVGGCCCCDVAVVVGCRCCCWTVVGLLVSVVDVAVGC